MPDSRSDDLKGPDAARELLDQVIDSFANTPDERLRRIVTAAVRHAHAFVREVQPTVAEWEAVLGYLTDVGQMCSATRQEFVLLSDVLGLSMLVETVNDSRRPGATESTVLGPFHVTQSPQRATGEDISAPETGVPCVVEVRVTSSDGAPLADANVDVWQCDGEGFYDVQRPGDVPPGTGRGLFKTDESGYLWFRTVVPSYYPIPTDGPVGKLLAAARRDPYRPAHVHFMVRALGHEDLTTHLFVADSPYLDADAVFAVRRSLVAGFVEVHDRDEAARFEMASPFRRAQIELVLSPRGATDGATDGATSNG